jgi:acyl-coenzyme A synthetase/AMP-(fatty) acid ligase/acetylornithine/succinyldiaminopimelate/putrescine aminotransferase/predicted amino acid dehydrogenase
MSANVADPGIASLNQGNRCGRFVNPKLPDLLQPLRLDADFVWAEGTRLRDASGREYLDFTAGDGLMPFGHNHKAIWDAFLSHRQVGEPGIVQPSISTAPGRLAERLIGIAPLGLKHVSLTNDGDEAIAMAIEACRLATGRLGIVAATNDFHGKILGALSATGARTFHKGFPASPPHFSLVPYGDTAALDAILDMHRGEIAAVVLAPIQGEGGVVVPPPGYLAHARDITTRHDVRLVLDEVQTGLGRTGALFASAAAGIQPDCLTIAMALGGGLVPVGACLFAPSVWSEDLAVRHSSTFTNNTLACDLGLAMLNVLTEANGRMLRNVRNRGGQLQAIHEQLRARFPNVVAKARGEGLLLGLAFNVRRESFSAEWGTYLGVFGEQGKIVPLIASYLLNVEGIRTTPTWNGSGVLRVEPPLTVSEAECTSYEVGITRTVELLAQGNTGALAAHLVNTAPLPLSPRPQRLITRQQAEPRPDGAEGRFAFLIHPLDTASLIDFDPSLKVIRPEGLLDLGERLSGFLQPFPIGATRVQAQDGSTAYGEFICVPRTARELQHMPQPEAQSLVAAAVDLARDRGAQIVGLGGYTSVVTLGGTRVLDRNVAITTGNSYTLVSAIEAVELACRRIGVSLDDAPVTVVGAGGAIGAGLVGRLFDRVGALTMVGRAHRPEKTIRRFETVLRRCLGRLLTEGPDGSGHLARLILAHPHTPSPVDGEAGLRTFAAQLMEENGTRVPLRWSLELASALPESDVVVCATSSADEIIRPEHMRPGAVLCDMSRPSNVSRRIADERPDVLVLDGGIVDIPGRPDFGFDIGIPRGLGYACLAETMMLALRRRYRHTSIGADLACEDQHLLTGIARDCGFRLAGVRSFDRLLNDMDWCWLRSTRLKQGAAGPVGLAVEAGVPLDVIPAVAAGVTRFEARQNPDSLEPGDLTNAAIYLLDRHLDARGDKIAIVDGCARYTYRVLHAKSVGMARLLRERGIGLGDTIAAVQGDSIEVVALLLAAMRIGATLALVNPDLRQDAIVPQFQVVQPALLFVSPGEVPTWTDHASRLGCPVLPLVCQSAAIAPAPVPLMVRADTPAVCLFSSGSTGRPKAVPHSHRDFVNTNLNYAKMIGVNENDVVFSPSRMFFAYGLNAVHQALFAGATSILAARRTVPEEVLARMEAEKVTLFFSVPTIYLLMLDRQSRTVDLSAMRLCVSAGEPLPVDLYDAWNSRFGIRIMDGIGCTETLSTFITNTPSSNFPGSLAEVVPGFEVRLLTEALEPAADGEIGTLWVRGNSVTKGYLGDEVTTDQIFKDGWFNTNDLFVRDGWGYFAYIGRAIDTFKVGGMWVSPPIVEAAIARHPTVARCAVVKHVDFGKLIRPKAFVVARPGVATGPPLAAEIKEFLRSTLARHQYPHIIEFVTDLPLTASGKIQRCRLIAQEWLAAKADRTETGSFPGCGGVRAELGLRSGEDHASAEERRPEDR